jgi:hypothetical protein
VSAEDSSHTGSVTNGADETAVHVTRKADPLACDYKSRVELRCVLSQSHGVHTSLPLVLVVLFSGADAEHLDIGAFVIQARVDASIEEYTSAHTHVKCCHRTLLYTFSARVGVNRRLGIGQSGMYQEHLARVM